MGMKKVLFALLILFGIGFAQDTTYLYGQGPTVRLLCYGKSKKSKSALETGVNLCSAMISVPFIGDIEEVHYLAQIYYLDTSGKEQIEELVFRQLPNQEQLIPINIPIYVPESDFLNGLFRLFTGASEAILIDGLRANAVVSALAGPTPWTLMSGLKGGQALIEDNRTVKFFYDAADIVDDLIGQKNRPYMLAIYARFCSLDQCSPWGSVWVTQ